MRYFVATLILVSALLLTACGDMHENYSRQENYSLRTIVYCAPNNVAYWIVRRLNNDHAVGGGLAVDQRGKPLSCEQAEDYLALKKAEIRAKK